MAKTNKSTCEPPFPSHFPWLVYYYGESFNTQTLYDIEDGNCYIKQIPYMSNKLVFANSHGWMVICDLDQNSDGRIFLLNPVSMEKMVLPPHEPNLIKKGHCILSLPPTDPACIVAFLSRDRPYIMFCHPHDEVWRGQEFDINNRGFENIVCCEGKIYCRNRVLDKFLEFRVLDNNKLGMTQLMGTPKDGHGIWYMVESLGDIFLVTVLIYLGRNNRFRDVIVYKMDLREVKWVRVNNLGDRVFFLSRFTSMSCSSIGLSGNVKKNSIYFTLSCSEEFEMTSMYVYDMEEKTITTCLACPNGVHPYLTAGGQWIMSNI